MTVWPPSTDNIIGSISGTFLLPFFPFSMDHMNKKECNAVLSISTVNPQNEDIKTLGGSAPPTFSNSLKKKTCMHLH